MENRLTVAQGSFSLVRLPLRAKELLQAWDAADEYLLEAFNERAPSVQADKRLLIVNDSFGALAVALNQWRPWAWSDSYLSQAATRLNLSRNEIAVENVTLLDSLSPLPSAFDYVLIKVPKTLALLEEQLIRLQAHLKPDSLIILGTMLKALPGSVWTLLEKILGSTTTSLAKKKARLIFVDYNPNLPLLASPYPVQYVLENTNYLLTNHANVFSRDSLDIGTRFFLNHIPVRPDARDIIDLGCGNGVVGLWAAKLNPAATLHFVDESFMAVASARENFFRAFPVARTAVFQTTDGLTGFAPESADIVLCNPPFHQQQVIGKQLALRMFRQAKSSLRRGGELWVIGNRHLGYQHDLKSLFGNCRMVAGNPKFVVLAVSKDN